MGCDSMWVMSECVSSACIERTNECANKLEYDVIMHVNCRLMVFWITFSAGIRLTEKNAGKYRVWMLTNDVYGRWMAVSMGEKALQSPQAKSNRCDLFVMKWWMIKCRLICIQHLQSVRKICDDGNEQRIPLEFTTFGYEQNVTCYRQLHRCSAHAYSNLRAAIRTSRTYEKIMFFFFAFLFFYSIFFLSDFLFVLPIGCICIYQVFVYENGGTANEWYVDEVMDVANILRLFFSILLTTSLTPIQP